MGNTYYLFVIEVVFSGYSDYGWVPAWGMVTENIIQKLQESGIKEFKMKDGSIIHFCTLGDAPKYSLQWVVDNPGICQKLHSKQGV